MFVTGHFRITEKVTVYYERRTKPMLLRKMQNFREWDDTALESATRCVLRAADGVPQMVA
jgi:hypothetical protein